MGKVPDNNLFGIGTPEYLQDIGGDELSFVDLGMGNVVAIPTQTRIPEPPEIDTQGLSNAIREVAQSKMAAARSAVDEATKGRDQLRQEAFNRATGSTLLRSLMGIRPSQEDNRVRQLVRDKDAQLSELKQKAIANAQEQVAQANLQIAQTDFERERDITNKQWQRQLQIVTNKNKRISDVADRLNEIIPQGWDRALELTQGANPSLPEVQNVITGLVGPKFAPTVLSAMKQAYDAAQQEVETERARQEQAKARTAYYGRRGGSTDSGVPVKQKQMRYFVDQMKESQRELNELQKRAVGQENAMTEDPKIEARIEVLKEKINKLDNDLIDMGYYGQYDDEVGIEAVDKSDPATIVPSALEASKRDDGTIDYNAAADKIFKNIIAIESIDEATLPRKERGPFVRRILQKAQEEGVPINVIVNKIEEHNQQAIGNQPSRPSVEYETPEDVVQTIESNYLILSEDGSVDVSATMDGLRTFFNGIQASPQYTEQGRRDRLKNLFSYINNHPDLNLDQFIATINTN